MVQLGIPKSTFYLWCDRYLAGGLDALEDRKQSSRRTWNKIPDTVEDDIVALALKEPDLSPRELAITFTDQKRYLVSEAIVYRLLKAHQPGLHPVEGRRSVRPPDHGAQPVAANRLHLSEGHRLGLVLSLNRSFSASILAAFARPNTALKYVLSGVVGILALKLTWPAAAHLFCFGPLHADDLLVTLGAGVMVLFILDAFKPRWSVRVNG